MITIRELGAQGLRKRIEAMAQAEGQAYASRKKAFDDRLSIYRGRHKHLIDQRIADTYELADLRKKLQRFASTRTNLLRRVAQTVAIAYDQPPSRSLKGAPEAEAKEFLKAYQEADTARCAEEWGKMAFVANVVHVIPRVVGDNAKLEWITVLPHKADVIFDYESGDRHPSILVYDTKAHGACRVAIDSERWVWLNDRYEIVAEEEHGMGMIPWVTFRFQSPPEDDYWDQYRGADLAEGTLDVARIAAQMAWTRKGHANDILYLFLKDTTADVPPNQTVNNEAPLMGRGDITLGRVENIVAVDEFLKEIRNITEDICESYGIPSTLVDLQPQSTQDAANVFTPAGPRAHAQLAKIRNRQVKHHEHSELELAVRVAALLRRHGRMHLTEEQVREMFRVRFAPLTYADHPKAQVATSQALGSMGADDPYEFYMSLHPELTFEEAREEVLRHIANRAEFFELVMRHNMPLDASNDNLSVAQIQGAIGGSSKGEKTAIGQDHSEERELP